MANSTTRQSQVKVNTKQTADDLTDKVFEWLGAVGLFLLMLYGITVGYDQAAWFFGLPQASPLEVGGALLFFRMVAQEIRYLYKILRP